MKIVEIILRHLILEEKMIEMPAMGDERRQTDVVLHAIRLHAVARIAIINQLVADLPVEIHVVQGLFQLLHLSCRL